jgi:DNA repair exonuclease SbcCD ATPase subunit
MSVSKIATIVSVVAAAALAAQVVMQYQTIQALHQETANLKTQVEQIAPLQEQLARATQDAAQAGGMETQLHELARLRGEVQRLRTQTNALAKAQQEISTLQQRVESVTETSKEQAVALQAEAQKKPIGQSARAMNACINNLRLIDAAKQQWALENRKQATDTPAMDDLRPYLGRGPNGEVPVCPDGGVYTVGSVGEKPTCSIPNHVLP